MCGRCGGLFWIVDPGENFLLWFTEMAGEWLGDICMEGVCLLIASS